MVRSSRQGQAQFCKRQRYYLCINWQSD